MKQSMKLTARSWIKKGLIAGIGGVALAFTLLSGTVSADDGKVCVAKDTTGKCVVYGEAGTYYVGGARGFITVKPQPITIDPGSFVYSHNKYLPYYCYTASGYKVAYAHQYCYGYTGFFGGTVISPYNLPPATYAVVAAAADALNADRGYIYWLLNSGENLDRVTDRYGVNNTIFLTNFYNQLDARLNELRSIGAIQEWQAQALRNNVRQPWFINQTHLLVTLQQY